MIKKLIQRPLKFLLVDSTVNILGNLFEQPLVMWAFIGWGWISILVMATSIGQPDSCALVWSEKTV